MCTGSDLVEFLLCEFRPVGTTGSLNAREFMDKVALSLVERDLLSPCSLKYQTQNTHIFVDSSAFFYSLNAVVLDPMGKFSFSLYISNHSKRVPLHVFSSIAGVYGAILKVVLCVGNACPALQRWGGQQPPADVRASLFASNAKTDTLYYNHAYTLRHSPGGFPEGSRGQIPTRRIINTGCCGTIDGREPPLDNDATWQPTTQVEGTPILVQRSAAKYFLVGHRSGRAWWGLQRRNRVAPMEFFADTAVEIYKEITAQRILKSTADIVVDMRAVHTAPATVAAP